MVNITDKSMCCGCTACAAVCPVQCIVMRRDDEGFDYPVANPDLCIGCGMCDKVCPMRRESVAGKRRAVAARSGVWADGSSSGGVFPVLAAGVLADGGSVFGAVLEADCKVGHVEATDEAGMVRMRGSKYVQSDMYSVYEDVRERLEEGKKVLFTGTPCQVAGLRAFLGEDRDGLLAVDCACHGVPSPWIWKKWLEAMEAKLDGKVVSVRFRDKSRSWRHYDMMYSVAEQGGGAVREYRVRAASDPYMALFLQDMTLRPSCYSCRLRCGSGSDLTMADLWNVTDTAPGMDDDRGVSLVVVNTTKGADALEVAVKSGGGLAVEYVDYEKAVRGNGGFAAEVTVPERRAEFFKGVPYAPDLYGYMSSFVKRSPFIKTFCRKLRSALSDVLAICKIRK